MGCQRKITSNIREAGADYVLSLKGNQRELFDDTQRYFDWCENHPEKKYLHDDTDAGHGRVERRVVETVDVEWLASRGLWADMQSLVRVQSERHVGEQISHETRYFISSLPVRAHWQVENGLHWCLDIAFSEDQQRMREGNAASNMALLSKIALNLLKHTKSKVGVKSRRKRAGWDNAFLLQALGKASSI